MKYNRQETLLHWTGCVQLLLFEETTVDFYMIGFGLKSSCQGDGHCHLQIYLVAYGLELNWHRILKVGWLLVFGQLVDQMRNPLGIFTCGPCLDVISTAIRFSS